MDNQSQIPAQTHAAPQSQQLLPFPAEVRNKIYKYVLLESLELRAPYNAVHSSHYFKMVNPSLFRVNRATSMETMHVFYGVRVLRLEEDFVFHYWMSRREGLTKAPITKLELRTTGCGRHTELLIHAIVRSCQNLKELTVTYHESTLVDSISRIGFVEQWNRILNSLSIGPFFPRPEDILWTQIPGFTSFLELRGLKRFYIVLFHPHDTVGDDARRKMREMMRVCMAEGLGDHALVFKRHYSELSLMQA